MKKITLSVNPTYYCNFRCDFCYLSQAQLSSSKKLDLQIFKSRLCELHDSHVKITHVDLYGGEVGLLPETYLNELENILHEFGAPKINIVTNLSHINHFFLKPEIDLTVSFDFDAREKHDLVLKNILLINKPISILMLASEKVIALNVEYLISVFNSLEQVRSVEIKPYSTNQANQHQLLFSDFEGFVQKWLQSNTLKKFVFVNENLIIDSLERSRNAFSNEHLYITPDGNFAVLEFDSNDREYFLSLKSYEEYLSWSQKEKIKIEENSFCRSCTYKGHCLTEHYRDVKNLENSCNGFKKLLDWSENYFL